MGVEWWGHYASYAGSTRKCGEKRHCTRPGHAIHQIPIVISCDLYDLITLDSALQGKYFQQLASGQALIWQGSSWDTTEVFIPVNTQGQFAATISKNASRLMTVSNTFVPRLTQADKHAGKQYCNKFLGFGQFADSRNDVQMQLHVGSTTYPPAPSKRLCGMLLSPTQVVRHPYVPGTCYRSQQKRF